MADCLLHAKGCDGRSPCNVEIEVRTSIADRGPLSKLTQADRARASKVASAQQHGSVYGWSVSRNRRKSA